jgi:uncharacterized protein (DUF433 family)
MRPFIERAREEFGVPYPLAHFRPLIDDKELVYRLQTEAGLDPELHLVRAEGDQIILAPVLEQFLDTVEFDPEYTVARLHPLGPRTPVVIDPRVAFGSPQIRGIRTDLIAESYEIGGMEEAARGWNVSPGEIDAAVTWERSLAEAA